MKWVKDIDLRQVDSGEVSDFTANDRVSECYVQQQFADEQDINTIVRRFGLTAASPTQVPGGVYGDFTGIQDYEGAVERIERARSGFMCLPAEVRDRFANDPGRLIRMASEVPEDEFQRIVYPPVVPPGGGVIPPVEGGS